MLLKQRCRNIEERRFHKPLTLRRPDGRVDRASASGSVDLGFDSESGQTTDLKIGMHNFHA